MGFIISIVITVLMPYDLYFLPSFIASILVIYMFRLTVMKDGLLAAFMTYFFAGAASETIVAALYYATDPEYSLTIDISIVVFPIINIITAVIAAYIAVRFAQRAKPAPEIPQPLRPLPPV